MKALFAGLLALTALPAWAGAQDLPSSDEAPPRPLVIAEVRVDAKHLDTELTQLAKQAAAEHKRVLVAFGAPWCVACALLDPVFQRERNRALFRGWELVQVDVDDLPEGPVLGIPFDTIPFFIKLDRAGHPAGTLRGSEALKGRGRSVDVDAAFARFLGT